MMSLQQAAQAVNGECHGGDVHFDAVSIDTRTLVAGSLYVAIRGERLDGHQFISAAEQAGACCLMVDNLQQSDLPQLLVKDCRLALGQLASYWRETLGVPVVAITGSNGKTSVKEMIASILAQDGEVYATRGNLNNDYGVPLTLLSLKPEHQYAVVEMGANHPGEIAYLTALAKPDVALVNNAGSAHLEGFGSAEGVARAKGEIYGGLSESGVAIINRDDHFASYWREICQEHKVITFGLESAADVSARWQGSDLGSELEVETPLGGFGCHLALPGEHNIRNALAAISCAVALGIDLEKIKCGLQAMQSVKGRLQRLAGANGANLIDDTYNANPNSFIAAIKVLSSCEGRRILVMGDMAELGENANVLHAEVGEQARAAGIDALYTLGEKSSAAYQTFAGDGHHYIEQQKMIEGLQKELTEGTTILIKGSRSMAMERVVAALQSGRTN